MVELIVIHSGPCHFDEVAAVSLLGISLGFVPGKDVRIERRNPSKEELADPSIFCVDVGLRHEPELGNFDHHQLPRGTKECAMSLVAKHLGYHAALETCPWYQIKIEMDACGPFSVAKTLGIEKFPYELMSPIESVFLDMIKDGEVEAWVLAHRIFEQILLEAQAIQQNVVFMRQNHQTFQIRGVWGFYIPASDIKGARQFKKELEEEHGNPMAFQISFDDRGEGMTLFRFEDHPQVDFSVLEGRPEILFAHKNGFLAKTKTRLRLDESLRLVAKAVKK